MKNQFVPYELAVKLRELGFDEECLGSFIKLSDESLYLLVGEINSRVMGELNTQFKTTKFQLIAPLWQQAFDWFRTKHNLYGVIIPTATLHWTFVTMTTVESMIEVPPYKHVNACDYSTYEEARRALVERLINLVENI